MTFQASAVIGDATQTDYFKVLAKVENLKDGDTDGREKIVAQLRGDGYWISRIKAMLRTTEQVNGKLQYTIVKSSRHSKRHSQTWTKQYKVSN